ncbi:MAG: phosphate ABC transporter ATP-binding protein [Candidatus Lokiarchaeota archaeon]|nr:phosphate ABC transporter ATP-binding protein [Candidatus Lokiarchaeota archaeon]
MVIKISENNQEEFIVQTRKLNLWFGQKHVLKDIDIDIKQNQVTALIGPSGCGKTTLIRTMNRMNDIFPSCKIEGKVLFHGRNIYGRGIDTIKIRTKIGMIFQKPNPFPMSVFSNIAYGPRVHGIHDSEALEDIVERSLKQAALWSEINDRLKDSGLSLSGGQQQRLCIARTLAIKPEVILMDEPCSALDPISTAKIEDLINELKKKFTVIIVTHNMQQAARISDYTGFMYLGELIEFGSTVQIFENPKKELTERYITGRFG